MISCSPRLRGWARIDLLFQICWVVFPTPAGMSLQNGLLSIIKSSVPRACGDEPFATDPRPGH